MIKITLFIDKRPPIKYIICPNFAAKINRLNFNVT